MRILLVRHGECGNSAEDIVLTAKGKEQAKSLAQYLEKIGVNLAFSSSLTRAKQTMEEFQKICPNVKCYVREDLNEIYRVIVGGPVRENTPKDREQKDKKRADVLFSSLIDMPDENIVIFTHGNLIMYLIAKILNVNPKKFWGNLIVSPGSMSIIEKQNEKLMVEAVNIINYQWDEAINEFYNCREQKEKYF